MRLGKMTAAFVVLAALVSGCSTMGGMERNDMESASVETFKASKEQVVNATKMGLKGLGYTIKDVKVSEPTTSIYFTKSMNLTSWGEIGRVDVSRLATSTQVSLASAKRYKLQFTGTSQDVFARRVFMQIRQNLPAER